MERILGFLRLARPANIVTAVSDILAGVAISGLLGSALAVDAVVVALIISTIGLYGGGVVMNDVFDAELDAAERPERPIPSGLIGKTAATIWGLGLLVVGVAAATFASTSAGLIAAAIAVAALIYDRWGKHHLVLGPLNMGLCRGLNLLLGMSAVARAVDVWWFLGLVPVIYIGAITMISRGEVHGGTAKTGKAAAVLYLMAMVSVAMVAGRNGQLFSAVFLMILWAAMVFVPLLRAIRSPAPKNVGGAVKAGVLGLILMNAAWAAAFGNVWLAVLIVALLPLSLLLARAFAVT